ncbi:transcriptional regulator [Microbacterium mangrovi]|uniref:Transcriptional regulator n=1 Tax=Microbacterium mangrovi TaxID=1348253 RepID=A0A0B1ZZS0_9MICO|nr:response regulator transcription factor [Microbacterium mangrovi]KHK96231.1 transcriptional regulator [Microbacterium mangrovi]
MAQLLVLSPTTDSALPSLGLLSHQVKYLHSDPASLVNAPVVDAVLLDARADLVAAKALCRILTTTDADTPVLLIVTEGGFAAVSPEWGVADVLLSGAGPAEVDARLRLALGRASATTAAPAPVQTSGVTIDEASYSAKVGGRPLDLTYKEFQLLHFFATHPSRVFTREQLLSEVWGYDYFGGTRTVDVHVRRLRAKLGEMEQIIGTVRNVGYRFNIVDEADLPFTETTPEVSGT